jgi:hypothetical protein
MATTRGIELVCERCDSTCCYQEWMPLHGPRSRSDDCVKVVRCGECGWTRPFGLWLAESSGSMRPPLAC